MRTMTGIIHAVNIAADESGIPCWNGKAEPVVSREEPMFFIGRDLEILLRMPFQMRLQMTGQMIREYGKMGPVFAECGAVSMEQILELTEAAAESGAAGISVISPLFFGAAQTEQRKYYLDIAVKLPEDFPMYLRCSPKLSSNLISRELVEMLTEDCPNIVGLIDGCTEADRMLRLSENREYQLLTDRESVYKIAGAQRYDGVIC